MDIITGILIALALAMDSFSVAITAGSSLKKVESNQAFLIACYFGVFQFLMTCLGWYGGSFFNKTVITFGHWIAIILLTIIGGKMILDSFKNEKNKKFVFTHKLLIILAIATSIDAFGVGLSYVFLNKPILIISIVIGITAFILSYIGVYLGKYLKNIFKNKMELIGGLILIGIGIKIAIDHGVFT